MKSVSKTPMRRAVTCAERYSAGVARSLPPLAHTTDAMPAARLFEKREPHVLMHSPPSEPALRKAGGCPPALTGGCGLPGEV